MKRAKSLKILPTFLDPDMLGNHLSDIRALPNFINCDVWNQAQDDFRILARIKDWTTPLSLCPGRSYANGLKVDRARLSEKN